MPEACPPGLAPDVALWRLLRVRGVDLPLVQLRERSIPDPSVEWMQAVLSQHGLHARGVHLDAHDLPLLECPTLLQLRDGSWLLLRNNKRDLIVEGADGLTRIAMATLAPNHGGWALELMPRLPNGAGLWPRVKALLRIHRHLLIQFAVASLVLQLLALMTPELTGLVIGRALPDSASQLLHLAAAALVATAVFVGAVGWIRERVALHLVTQLEVIIKRGVVEHVLRLPFPEVQKRNLGHLLQAFYGLSNTRTLFAERAFGALFDGVLAVAFLGLMGAKMLGPTLVMLLAVLTMAALAVMVGRSQARLQMAEVAAQANQRGYLAELIAGMCTIRAAGAESQCHQQWLKYLNAELQLTLRQQRVGLWSDVGLQAAKQALSISLLLWGGYSVLIGDIGIGTLFSFMLLAEGFANAVLALINTYLLLAVAQQQLSGATELLSLQATPITARRREGPFAGAVEMKDVWFRYESNGPWILEGYNLRVESGSKHLLDGPSGCGKSTILRLLAGLYVPERGTITIAGRDVRHAPIRALYLPQFVQLNAGSIIDNLRALSGGAQPQRLLDAAALTGFSDVVALMAMGYHTPLPHDGRTLSGGQRQLLALTAMLASDCDLLLLDEPMANMDPILQDHLAEVMCKEHFTIISAGHV